MVASGCGLLALSPLFLVVAIWIKFRNENELMEQAEDLEDYYIHVIMQEKIRLYLAYVGNALNIHTPNHFSKSAFSF